MGELELFLALKVPFFGHFYKGLYIRKVRFWDIPGRTRIDVESRRAIKFSFCKKVLIRAMPADSDESLLKMSKIRQSGDELLQKK